MKSPEELLAIAFADNPSDSQKIVFRVRSSPLKNASPNIVDSAADTEELDGPSNWMEYAKMLEESGKPS